MHEHRKWLMEAIERVADGHALKAWTRDTIHAPGHCAQLVRELVEGNLGLGENTWPVAIRAHEYRKARGGAVRYAADYEKAATALGLIKPNADMKPGDVLYWPYTARDGNSYGHTALYAGNGYVLENTDANAAALLKKGARQPLGKGTQVFLTPLSLRGEPRLTAWPSAALRDAERQTLPPPAPAPKPTPSVQDIPATPPQTQPPRRVLVPDGEGGWKNLAGKTFHIDGDVVSIRVDAKDGLRVEIEGGNLNAVLNLDDALNAWVRFDHRRK